MRRNIIKERSFKFAARIVLLHKKIVKSHREFHLSKQLLKSGTSVGANVRESEHAESSKDFIHKLSIAQKESNETIFWLELLKETGYLSDEDYNGIYMEAKEIISILTSIIKTMKRKISA